MIEVNDQTQIDENELQLDFERARLMRTAGTRLTNDEPFVQRSYRAAHGPGAGGEPD